LILHRDHDPEPQVLSTYSYC